MKVIDSFPSTSTSLLYTLLMLNLLHWSLTLSDDVAEVINNNRNNKTAMIHQKKNVTIGYLPAVRGELKERLGLAISGAITLAIDEINNDVTILPNVTLLLQWNDTRGDTTETTRVINDMIRNGVDVFIGPEGSCLTQARMAASKNIPIISYRCYDYEVSEIPTFARTDLLSTHIIKSVVSLLMYFKWNTFSIVYEENWKDLARALKRNAEDKNMTVNGIMETIDIHKCCSHMLKCCSHNLWNEIIEETKNKTRIYVFLGPTESLIHFMNAMDLARLFEKGEYMVVYIDTSIYYPETQKYFWRRPYIPEDEACDKHPNFLERIQSLFVVGQSQPSDFYYTKFATLVREYNAREPFNFIIPSFFTSSDKGSIQFGSLSIYAAYLYDAVKLYARALHQLLSEQDVLTDDIIDSVVSNGTKIIETIINFKSYESITGLTMRLDEFGSSYGDFTLLALKRKNNNDTEKHFSCPYQMAPIGQFNGEVPIFKLNQEVEWPGGAKPTSV